MSAHDIERTQVSLTFSRDGSFVLDVANDPNWLPLRLERFTGPFPDRIVLWVDGREIRPTSVEYTRPFDSALAPDQPRLAQGRPLFDGSLAIYRMRGRMPIDARTLRWYYGLVIDPYPLTIRRADGRIIVEEIAGNAWSRTIDLSGQFHAPLVNEKIAVALLAGLLIVPVALRLRLR